MEQIILVVHLLIALAIIGLIMLQQGKGADVGASFGAGASQTLFGSAGSSNVLTKSTAWLVVLFFATSFGLAMLASNKTKVVDNLDLVIPARKKGWFRYWIPTCQLWIMPSRQPRLPQATFRRCKPGA